MPEYEGWWAPPPDPPDVEAAPKRVLYLPDGRVLTRPIGFRPPPMDLTKPPKYPKKV